jgi:hypothetical protein
MNANGILGVFEGGKKFKLQFRQWGGGGGRFYDLQSTYSARLAMESLVLSSFPIFLN